MQILAPVTLSDVQAARPRIEGAAVRTPLIPIEWPGGRRIWLKLECLQPIGSFKIRGAANAMACADPEALTRINASLPRRESPGAARSPDR